MNTADASLTVRHVRSDDGPAMAAIYAPFVTDSAVSFEYEPPSASEMAKRALAVDTDYAWLVAECDGQCMGYAYAGSFRSREAYRWTVEVSAYLAPAARGRGIGARLYHDLFALLSSRGYRMAIAVITLPNPASVAFHERLGFAPAGVLARVGYKFGRAHDVGYFQRAIEAMPAR